MATLLYSHPACLDHDTGAAHPESAERLRAVLATLGRAEFAALERRRAPRAELGQLSRVHERGYIARILGQRAEGGRIALDFNTVLSPGSGEAALRAAGAVCAAVDAVAAGEARNAFCAVRPPGHHAERARAMGFCLFNNVAIGALHARAARGYERVAVIDFDRHHGTGHHGNGTQEVAEHHPELYFVSTHQPLIFPNTGVASARSAGNVLSIPLARGWGGPEFRRVLADRVLPALRSFGPDFVLLSAGFDAHLADPIGDLRLVNADFRWATAALAGLAAECCEGRLVSTLEGGYGPRALAAACAVHVEALMAA